MASEKDLELLDDYIRNRLKGPEKEAFQQKLNQDPTLQSEFNFQLQLAEGIRSARAAELKHMLNQIPQSAMFPDNQFSFLKWGGISLIVLLGLGALWFFQKDQNTVVPNKSNVEQKSSGHLEVITPEPKETTEPVAAEQQKDAEVQDEKPSPSGKNSNKANGEQPATSEPRKLDVFDPTGETETTADDETSTEKISGASASAPTVVVDTDNTSKKYTFHYQYRDNKVVLYGSFEKNLYEILEFITDNKRTVFLFYKNNYYLLNQNDGKVTPLSPVNDPVLLKKLRDHRNN